MAEAKAGEAKKRKLVKGRHKSAIKRHRQNQRHASRNRRELRKLQAAVKKVRASLVRKDKSAAQSAFVEANSLLDRAAASGILHRRNASRHIARLASAVAQL